MAKAYFGSRLSDNIIKTPEGYLVCKNVPIARTGIQQYLGQEFGAPHSEQTYDVRRPEQEVFSKAAIASFEGKPVTDDHPSEDVTPDNYTQYMKGVCRDVHRGEGEFSQCLVADLIIYDSQLIREINEGKREISCGYDCLWEPTSETGYDQLEIRGNHIAVVDKGRAGHKVAIRDAQIKKAKEKKSMNKNSIIGRMLAAFAKDEGTTPEELTEAAKLANDEVEANQEPEPIQKPTMDEELEGRLKKIEDALSALTAKQGACDLEEEPDALDELEEEIESEEPAQVDDEEVIEPAEENEASRESRDAAIACIRGFKPFIAKLPAKDRKRVADSIAILIRGNMANDSQYNELQDIQRKTAGRDAAYGKASDYDYGRMIRDKYNPHYAKEVK